MDDRRRAERVECRLPVRLRGAGRWLVAHTVNLSRVGVLVRLPRQALRIAEGAEARDVVREVNRRLDDVVVAELHYEVLGALVRKGLRVVRIAVCPDQPDHVELGCDLSTVLSDEEIGFLGVDLPEIVDGARVETGEDAVAALFGYLCSADDDEVLPLVAPVIGQSDRGLVLRIRDPQTVPVLSHRSDIGARFESVTDAYGDRPRVLLVHGVKPVWCGGVRVEAVERPAEGTGFDVHLRFGTALGPGARARLAALAKRAPVPAVDSSNAQQPAAARID